jgi:hypothetical protein
LAYTSVITLESLPIYLTGVSAVIRLLARYKKNVGSFPQKRQGSLSLLKGVWSLLYSLGICTYFLPVKIFEELS